MKFKQGQKVVMSVDGGKWVFSNKALSFWKSLFKKFRHGFGPKFNEIVTVDGYSHGEYLYLKEYQFIDEDGSKYTFNENAFEPIMSEEHFAKELASIPEFQTN